MKKIFFALIAILFFSPVVQAQATEDKDSVIFHKIITGLSGDKNMTTAERVITAAQMLLETPYVAGTLEQVPERLIVNLHETDCILFVETCLALAITAAESDHSFARFKDVLKNLRYRNGVIDGYTSRLHYTSEWIRQAEKNGFVKEVSKEIANTSNPQKFFFMSSHPESYKQLSGNTEEMEKIKRIESNLNGYEYFYIPKNKIPQYLSQIKAGDIIGFNTSVQGLDLTHVGIAFIRQGEVTFIHASSNGKKVMIEPENLVHYVNKIKSNNGIRIIRIK